MYDKPLHIVFQVLNFLGNQILSSPYDLSADEKLLLIFLSKHKGHRGIYPSVLTLAKELQRSESAIRRSLRRLKKKNLIIIDQIPGKSSQYTLILPDLDLSTAPGVHAQGYMDIPQASTPGGGKRPRLDTPGVHARQSIQSNNPMNNTERARMKRAAPLSDDFEPNKQTCKAAQNLGLTEDEANFEFDKFMTHHQALGSEKKNWDKALENWFIKAAEYKDRHQGEQKAEVRSMVKEYVPEPEFDREANREVAKKALGQIFDKLKLNGSGGHHGRLFGQMEKGETGKTK